MSKWSLLKAALVTRKRDCDNPSSIHRFGGYNVIEKKKLVWQGFNVLCALDSSESCKDRILYECYEYMDRMDSTECCCHIYFTPGEKHQQEQISQLLESKGVRQHSMSDRKVVVYIIHPSLTPSLEVCEYWCYKMSIPGSESVELHTREKPKDNGLSVKSLLSNKLHGVDNTGNICVWPAEPMLLHTLLTVERFRDLVRSQHVLEIGGGMTALAGLGLAVVPGLCASVTVTDGHPDCVRNQAVCIGMCQQLQQQFNKISVTTTTAADRVSVPDVSNITPISNESIRSPISVITATTAELLHWSPSSNTAQVERLTRNGTVQHQQYGAVLASDCLFFKEFHWDLLHTLAALLSPTGVVIMLQPSRDNTMELFIARCAEHGTFTTEVVQDYSPEISALRVEYLQRAEELGYNEEIHYPVMLLLRRR